MPDRAGRLALARKPRRGDASAGAPSVAAREERLRQTGAAEHRLDRPDVRVLAMVRGGHDRDLLVGQVELLGATRLEQRGDGEWLDRGAQRGDVVRVAHTALDLAGDIDLDDVAAMAALDERTAAHLGQHGRSHASRVAGARQRGSDGCSAGWD